MISRPSAAVQYTDPSDKSNLIFLPFNQWWSHLVIVSTLISCTMNWVQFVFRFETANQSYIYYILEILFLVDTIGLTAHKLLPTLRKIRPEEPISSLILFLNVASLMPYYEVQYLLHLNTWDLANKLPKDNYRIKVTARLGFVLYTMQKRVNSVGLSHLKILVMNHVIRLALLFLAACCIWYQFACYGCSEPNWTHTIRIKDFDGNSSFHWFVMSYYTSVGIICHNWIGVIVSRNKWEWIFVIVGMVIGVMFHIMIYFGELTAAFIHQCSTQFQFTVHLKKVLHLMDEWEQPKEVRKHTVDYFNSFWEKRRGMIDIPIAMTWLPLSMQKTVNMDIFWDALRHSHLLSDTDIAFKRTISMAMRSEFLLPGEYIYRKGQMKYKMVYVVSGVVQILTDEDNESAILSFSSGTLMGECTILFPVESIANVKCATHCELHTLSLRRFVTAVANHDGASRQLGEQILKRIERAKMLQERLIVKRPDIHSDDSVIRLKQQWRTIYETHSNKKKEVDDTFFETLDNLYSSMFLDLIVLSEEVELKIQAICLTSYCPLIMEPTSSFRVFCQYIVSVCVLAEFFVVPTFVFFDYDINDQRHQLLFVLDLGYYLDIYLQLTTAVYLQATILSSFFDIFIYRSKQLSFIFDVITSIPYSDILKMLHMTEYEIFGRVPKVFKIYKIFVLVVDAEKNPWQSTLFLKMIKYFSLQLVMIYLIASTLYAITCLRNACNTWGWFAQGKYLTGHSLITSFYYASSIYLDVGFSDAVPTMIVEVILICVIILVGYLAYSFTYTELTAVAVLNVRNAYSYQDDILVLDSMVKRRRVDPDLRQRTLRILNFNVGFKFYGPDSIFQNMSEALKKDILHKRIVDCLKLSPLFQEMDDRIISYFVNHMRISVLPPGTQFINREYIAMTVYVIIRGYCTSVSSLPGDQERGTVMIRKRGDVIAPLELMHRVKSFVTVRALTSVEVMQMSYSTFMVIYKGHPSEHEPLQNTLKEHMAKNENTLYKKGCRLWKMVSVKRARGKVDSFNYRIYKSNVNLIDEYKRPFLKTRHWAWLRYILFRSTISPTGKFFIAWEIFRMLTIFTDVGAALSLPTILLPYPGVSQAVEVIFCCMAAVDMYIRMHCQYYNNYGVLVTHPLFTAKHYIFSSFPIDLLVVIPHTTLKSEYMLGRNYEIQTKTVMMILLRPLMMYRFYKAMTYIEQKVHWSKGSRLIKIKYTTFLILLLVSLADILLILTCRFPASDGGGHTMDCSRKSWLTANNVGVDQSVFSVFIECFYMVVVLYANALSGTICLAKHTELWWYIPLQFFSVILRCLVLAGFASCTTGGNVNLSTYQSQMKQFLKFSKEVHLDKRLVKATIDYNEFLWKETQGTNIAAVCAKFNIVLRAQFTCFLYRNTLHHTAVLCTISEPFARQVSQSLQEVYFQKGAIIINCNDVQSYLYIVHTGCVTVTVAGCTVAKMENGGMFGCFLKHGNERQTITVEADEHTTVLVISSREFHKLLEHWGEVQAEDALSFILSTRQEFATATECEISGDMYERFLLRKLKGFWKRYYRFICKLNDAISIESYWYQTLNFILNIHIAFASSMLALLSLCSEIYAPPNFYIKITLLVTDFLFMVNIFKGFAFQYIDPTTGNAVRNPKKIAKRYLRSWFAFDLLVSFPLEPILCLIVEKYMKLGNITRVLRYLHVWYICHATDRLVIGKAKRYMYLLYKTIFYVQLGTSIWLILVCTDKPCKYVVNIRGRPSDIKDAEDQFHSILIAYTFIVNIFSSTGSRAVSPISDKEIIVTILVAFGAQYIISTLTSGFTSLIIVGKSTLMTFQLSIDNLRYYLKSRDLSPTILRSVWDYLLHLWSLDRGDRIPSLIRDAPWPLKEDIMNALYSSHVETHFLFANTHKDFLRQVVVHLERCIYLPGNYIVEQGDVDATMYFIHKGEVGAYTMSSNFEQQLFMLSTNMSFGEAQGLHRVPYQLSYKALSTVEVLALRKKAWEYLLNHFPASREMLKMMSDEYGLLMDTYYSSKSVMKVTSSFLDV